MPVVLVFSYLKDKMEKHICPEMSIWAKGHNNLFFINANNFLAKGCSTPFISCNNVPTSRFQVAPFLHVHPELPILW